MEIYSHCNKKDSDILCMVILIYVENHSMEYKNKTMVDDLKELTHYSLICLNYCVYVLLIKQFLNILFIFKLLGY